MCRPSGQQQEMGVGETATAMEVAPVGAEPMAADVHQHQLHNRPHHQHWDAHQQQQQHQHQHQHQQQKADSMEAQPSAIGAPASIVPSKPAHPYQQVIDFTVKMLCHLVVQGEYRARGLRVCISGPTQMRLAEYVARMLDKSACPSECLPTALLFLWRLRTVETVHFTRENVCLLFASAVILASKWLEDNVLSMSMWARISGFDMRTLLQLERDMLAALNWDLFHDPEEYLQLIRQGSELVSA